MHRKAHHFRFQVMSAKKPKAKEKIPAGACWMSIRYIVLYHAALILLSLRSSPMILSTTEPVTPRLHVFGKVMPSTSHGHHASQPQISGQFLETDGKVAKIGLPTTRGHRFVGDTNAAGQRHGFGIEALDDGYSFAGDFRENKKSGRGCVHRGDRFQFRGEFADDQASGHGDAIIADQLVINSMYGHDEKGALAHICRFRHNKPHGEGAVVLSSGMQYSGSFRDSHFHGVGEVKYTVWCANAQSSVLIGCRTAGAMPGSGRTASGAGLAHSRTPREHDTKDSGATTCRMVKAP
jgi:hypothetical protein